MDMSTPCPESDSYRPPNPPTTLDALIRERLALHKEINHLKIQNGQLVVELKKQVDANVDLLHRLKELDGKNKSKNSKKHRQKNNWI